MTNFVKGPSENEKGECCGGELTAPASCCEAEEQGDSSSCCTSDTKDNSPSCC
ncbi:hypothetical protein BBR01nite_15930 [Brevibacillus brevis]|nr:hypothetical protein BBR01nite_15930 [Brevibacillus brevis]